MRINTDTPARPLAGKRFALIAAVKLAVTAALLGLLLVRTPVYEVVRRFGDVAPGTLIAAVALLLLTLLAISIRWKIVLNQFGGRADALPAMRYTLIGGFFNQVLPSGMGGDVFRIWYARGFGLSAGRALASVVVDRMFGLFAIAAIVTAGVPFVLWLKAPGPLVAGAIAAVALLAGGISLFLALDLVEAPLEALVRRVTRGRVRSSTLRAIAGAAWSARSSRAMLAAWPRNVIAIGISIACQLVVGFVVFLLLRDLGQKVALATVLFLFPFVQLLSMLPISFAGWGLREGAMVVAFQLAGVPAEAALGASILFGLCLLTSSIPGAAVWLLRSRHYDR